MKKPSMISHPLINRTGISQRTRIIAELQEKAPEIDGSTLADQLYRISQYAEHINFPQLQTDQNGNTYKQVASWSSFFKDSLPFQLASISKVSSEKNQSEFESLMSVFKEFPSAKTAEALLRFVMDTFIYPLDALFKKVVIGNNSFLTPLTAIVKTYYNESLKDFIKIANASQLFLGVSKINFMPLTQTPWQIPIAETFNYDLNIKQTRGGKKEAFAITADKLKTLFLQFQLGYAKVIATASQYIEEAIYPLQETYQKKHTPHLGLIFAFLELFKHLQGDVNSLTKRHLDFFYKEVLQLQPKEAIPDQAHLIFEIAKHLDSLMLEKELLLKDGKDANNQNIIFSLDHDLIIDKAQIKSLKTLAVNTVKKAPEFIEGVYISPVANSSDGLGAAFPEGQLTNWSTVGGKFGKKKISGSTLPEELPLGRLGFVLASPVLLLQEGERNIQVTLSCGNNSSVLDGTTVDLDMIKNNLEAVENSLFLCHFSGEKKWLPTEIASLSILKSNDEQLLIFQISIQLNVEFPAVVFYNESILKDKFDFKTPTPVLKIELNPEAYISLENNTIIDACKLKYKNESGSKKNQVLPQVVSPYHYLRFLKLMESNIEVSVCGIKNLIVQNDESVLNINSQMFPFGLRPNVSGFDPMNQLAEYPEPKNTTDNGVKKDDDTVNPFACTSENPQDCLGPSFYIGSKEVLFKNWDSLRVNIEWKEKPNDFRDHYKAYIKRVAGMADGGTGNDRKNTILDQLGLVEENFKIKVDHLQNGSWNQLIDRMELFSKSNPNFLDDLSCVNQSNFAWEITNNNAQNTYVDFDQELNFFKTSINGFLKFTLADQDFLHEEYPFVLARQMLAYAFSAQGDKLSDAIYVKSDRSVIQASQDLNVNANAENSIEQALANAKFLKTNLTELVKFVTDNNGAISLGLKAVNELVIAACEEYNKTNSLDNLAVYESDLNSFNVTLTGLVKDIILIRDELKPNDDDNNRNLGETLTDSISIANETLDTFFEDLLAIIQDQNTGLNKKVADVVALLNDTNNDLDDIKGPIGEIDTQIGTIVNLANANKDPLNGDGLKTKVAAVKDAFEAISSYITANFDTVVNQLTLLVNPQDIPGDQDTFQELINQFGFIKTDFQNLSTKIAGLCSGNNLDDLILDFEAFVRGILGRLDDKNENTTGELIDLSTSVIEVVEELNKIFVDTGILDFLSDDALQALIPNEPWTPTIKNLYIDYTAKADNDHIDIVHLYPFESSAKLERIEQNPSLFPIFDDEGTLFVGLDTLTPGGNLSLLFQLAEATADSEIDKANVEWFYLSDNTWKVLRPDFNIVSDDTKGLTVSGIITIAIPQDITNTGNTQMPEDLFWLKATVKENAKAIAETLGIHTQTAKASAQISKNNDTQRLSAALAPKSVDKLLKANFSIKKVQQPYPSFGGRPPEANGHFYTRVSEQLKHKGRGVMIEDYEKIILEAFPEVYKVKCISHTMGLSAVTYQKDLEVAPGFALITVIPDLTKLVSGNQLAPKLPVSILQNIEIHIRNRISAFARIKIMNPRYEPLDVTIRVQLKRGKSVNFYQKKLQEDVTNYLAPWLLEGAEKISFGMPVMYSDVVGYVEQLDYVNFIKNLVLEGGSDQKGNIIYPLTARSVIGPGEICVEIEQEFCSEEQEVGSSSSIANPS